MISNNKSSYLFSPQEELERILSNINTWGLDVFTANSIIRENRVLTCTTFRLPFFCPD